MTPSVASFHTKVGATISGGNNDSSSGYLDLELARGFSRELDWSRLAACADGAERQHNCDDQDCAVSMLNHRSYYSVSVGDCG